MKISDLITLLLDVKNLYGDLYVCMSPSIQMEEEESLTGFSDVTDVCIFKGGEEDPKKPSQVCLLI